MRKIKYLVASFLMLAAFANANPVNQFVASNVAANYYIQSYDTTPGILRLAYTERDAAGQPVYYVYNISARTLDSKDGFVIVSAEDAGYPIIGSSNVGEFVIPTANSNIGFWMNCRKKEIIAIRTNNLKATSDISDTWNAYYTGTSKTIRNTHQSMSAVTPLLGSITWDQSPYYNAMCPHSSVTGCVATAMAQIMKYWQYPSVGLSSTCYYDETVYGFSENYGQLCATFDTSNYVWSAMPNKVTSANAQVAKLMYDCGVSVSMDYSPTGSGAFVTGRAPSAQNSYVEYFGYYKWSIQGVTYKHYTPSAWITLLENEFNLGRPVQYQGTDSVYGGHSWVCDGYNASNELHMNWGWSGADNGYYSAANLSVGGYDFSDQGVGAIIGIEPPSKGLGVAQVPSSQPLKVYPNPSNGIVNVELETLTGNPQITIYNMLGQQVYSAKLTTIQTGINLSNQSKGIYLYRVLNENGDSISTGRLVIQ